VDGDVFNAVVVLVVLEVLAEVVVVGEVDFVVVDLVVAFDVDLGFGLDVGLDLALDAFLRLPHIGKSPPLLSDSVVGISVVVVGVTV
jgi:hypothetical protein